MAPSTFEYPEAYYNTRSAEEVMPILVRMFNPASLLDVGCGNGSWLVVAKQMGIADIQGLDQQEPAEGVWPLAAGTFMRKDLSEPFDLHRSFDLVLCLEVAEHLPPEAAEDLVRSLARHGRRIVFSAAIPRQGGEGHLNERAPGYWQSLFNAMGYRTYDDIRPLIWSNEKVQWWYRQNIFLAIHQDIAGERPSSDIAHLVHPEIFWETSGFRILAEDNIAVLREECDARERFWQGQDGSRRYHLNRLVRLTIDALLRRK